jgi:hypothetical protein
METAKLFTTGGSQAVRLPRDFRFEGKRSPDSQRREGGHFGTEIKAGMAQRVF